MRRATLFLSALVFLYSLRGQSVTGPIEGFIFDAPTESIRAVTGSLGSASLGAAVVSQLEFASVAPRQNYGIVFRRGQFLLVSQLGSGQVSSASLQEPQSVPDGVVWSDDGSVAVLYSQSGNWIQTFTGFPNSVTAGTPVSLSPLGGSLSAIATDLHGQNLAIGIQGDNAGVYRIISGQGFVPVLNIASPAALAFSPDGATLYALDGAANQVSQLALANSATQTWPLGTKDAVAIKAANNASNLNVLYVAGRGDHLLIAFDTTTHQQVSSLPLSFAPTAIEPLGNNSFSLGARASASDPLWSFTNLSQPAVYFVPATPLPSHLAPREVRPK